MNTELRFSSASDMWETPQWLFDELNKEFKLILDVCATRENTKCKSYFDEEVDGLKQSWQLLNNYACWMNPPYGRDIYKWVKKAYEESRKGVTVVCLLPSRTDTRYFHNYIWDKESHQPKPGVKIRFLKGRLKFGNATNSAPFPSMIVIFSKG